MDGKYYENPILINFNQIINLFRNTYEKKEIKKLIILKGLT